MTKKTRSNRVSRAVMPIIAGLFLASGVIRLGGGTAQALTEELRDLGDRHTAAHPVAETKCPPPPELADLLAAFKAREAALDEREANLEEKAATLEIANEEINRQMAALEAAEKSLKTTLAVADGAAEADVAKLTAVYETMKPEQAAALFSQMDPQFAAGFLGRMRPESAAAIMAGLEPNTAYTMSVILAGRNARAPKE